MHNQNQLWEDLDVLQAVSSACDLRLRGTRLPAADLCCWRLKGHVQFEAPDIPNTVPWVNGHLRPSNTHRSSKQNNNCFMDVCLDLPPNIAMIHLQQTMQGRSDAGAQAALTGKSLRQACTGTDSATHPCVHLQASP